MVLLIPSGYVIEKSVAIRPHLLLLFEPQARPHPLRHGGSSDLFPFVSGILIDFLRASKTPSNDSKLDQPHQHHATAEAS
jgi:hypothetical protein